MFRQLRWQLLITLAGLLLVAGYLFNLVNQHAAGAIPYSVSTYTEGLAGRVQTINPLLWETSAEHDLVSLVFSGLTRSDEQGYIVADLAEDWTVMDDGLTYAFTIREDAKWHDGEPVTADDVLYTIGLLQSKQSDLQPDQASLWRTVSVDKLDRHTVRFSLAEPLASFLDYTTLPLLPAHRLENVTADALPQAAFNQAPIGSGPFRLVELDEERVRLAVFDEYYGPQPYLEELEFRLYPDLQSLLTAYEAGEIQGISQLPSEDLDRANQLDELAIYSAQQARCVALILNLDQPALKDRQVRRALLMAIDRRGLIDDHLGGQGIVAHSPIFPNSWAYAADTPTTQYDVAGARELLEEAGWVDSNGDGIRDQEEEQLALEILTNQDPVRQAIAESIADYWETVGVRASVRTTNVATLRGQHLQPRQFDVVLYGWVQTTADPDPYALWHSSQAEGGQNYAGLKNPAVDQLLEEGRRTTDAEVRHQIYREFQKLFAREVPALLLYYPVYHYAVDRDVHNVQIPRILFQANNRFQTLYRWHIESDLEENTSIEPLLSLLQLWNRNNQE